MRTAGLEPKSWLHNHVPAFFVVLLILLGLQVLAPRVVYGGQITLAWDANTEPDLQGYKIYCRTGSSAYSLCNTVTDKLATTATVSVESGVRNYFVATAYDTYGLESDYSNEVYYDAPSGCTYSISPSNQTFTSSGGTGSITVTTQGGCAWGAATGDSWVTITSGVTGAGNGTVGYSVSANASSSQRSVGLTVAGKGFTVSQAGLPTYTVTTSAGTGGSISPSGSVSVAQGGNQSFSISPNSGYSVSGVSVDGTPQGAITSYTFNNVNAGHSISATFAVNTFTLTTTTAGTGSGTVSKSPSGTSFPSGTAVTLTATADASSTFSGWSGGGCSGNNPTCGVTVTSNTSVSATFTKRTFTVTPSAGTGGSVSPASAVSADYGSNYTFNISPANGYVVSSVMVDGSSAGAVTSYTFSNITANHTIAASFSALPPSVYTLTTSTSGSGTGTVVSSQPGTSFTAGTVITLTATAGANSTFSGWSGACSGSSTTCQVTMNGNKTVNVAFTANPVAPTTYTLDISITGSGTGNVLTSPTGTASFTAGTLVTLTAAPGTGSTFGGWSGACTGTSTTCQITMNSNASVTATFALPDLSIVAAASSGGSVSPLGVTTVVKGGSQTYAFEPDSGYKVKYVEIDGKKLRARASYTFQNVDSNHTVKVWFVGANQIAAASAR